MKFRKLNRGEIRVSNGRKTIELSGYDKNEVSEILKEASKLRLLEGKTQSSDDSQIGFRAGDSE